MTAKVLITGGAGFIGSHLAKKLHEKGYEVFLVDNLSLQIHGHRNYFEDGLTKVATCILGNIESSQVWSSLPDQFDFIYHLASETGTGQSMYSLSHYASVNVLGTALLMEYVAKSRLKPKKIILSSTRAVYGEGAYACENHGQIFPEGRKLQDLTAGKFEPLCPFCGSPLILEKTKENGSLKPKSIYGITKLCQEQMIMESARSFSIPCVTLRFQNVYGPGQSLFNPYTGILSIFSTRIRQGKPLSIFEDGKESRDFVFIDDVVRSLILSLEKEEANDQIFNIGSGEKHTVLDVARLLQEKLDLYTKIEITGNFRLGDIRHNVADISKAQALLGFDHETNLSGGLGRFASWVLSQPIPEDHSDLALQEMKERGLFK
jgi:dTDP-L-rhamnose 4-epimerase